MAHEDWVVMWMRAYVPSPLDGVLPRTGNWFLWVSLIRHNAYPTAIA